MSEVEVSGGRLREPVGLPLVWNASDVAVLVANQFAILGTALDGFFLTMGQVVPPPTSGQTDEERRESLQKVGAIQVRPIGSFSISEGRIRELHAMLQRVINDLDSTEEA